MSRSLFTRILTLWPGALLAQTQSLPPLPPLPLPGKTGSPLPGGPLPGGPPPGAMPPGAQPPGELLDIVPPVEIGFWTPRNTSLAVLCGVLLLALLFWLLRRWLKRARPLPPPPDPVKTALKALDHLSSQTSLELSPKEFAAAVAGVIRRFLESKHGLNAPRQTTEEFLEATERSNRFALPVREQMRLFLGHCDALKFSRLEASEEARKDLLKAAYKLVQEELV